jgi:nitrite reductase (NADH) large subunit
VSHLVIVGMGAAGFSAAEAIRKNLNDAAITVVTDEPHGFYSRPGLAYVLTNELPEHQLFPGSGKSVSRLGLKPLIQRVVRLEPDAHQVVLADGRRLDYDALLLAPGAEAMVPTFPGADLPGVVTLDDMDDTREIWRRARRAKSAVVIGGGITALELVEGLRAQKVTVHYFLRRERFWSSVLDPVESRMVEDRLAHEGILIHRHTEINQIVAKKDWRGRKKIAAVETNSGKMIRCDMVAVAVGVRPRLELINGTNIQTDRGILVNECMESNVPGIFAAGDVAQVFDPLTGKSQLDVLWPVAVAQGRVAGANMAGVATTYRRAVPLNVTRLAGMVVTLVGSVGNRRDSDGDLVTISRGDSEVWRGIPNVIVVYDHHEINRQRLIIKENRLVGAIIVGDQTLSPLVEHLIQQRVDIGAIVPALKTAGANLVDILHRLPTTI